MLYFRKGTANTIKVNVEDMNFANPTNGFRIFLTNLITDVEQVYFFTATSVGKRCLEFTFTEPTNLALVDEGSYSYRITATNNDTVNRGLARVHEGVLSAETTFGNEVKYTEHTNVTTNTQYITI